MPENAQTTAQLHSSHMLAKESSKFSKPGFNSKWTVNSQMFKVDLEKAEEPEIILPTSVGSSKWWEFQKNTYFCFIDYAKSFVYITAICGKFLKRWEYSTTWPASWEICMHISMQQLDLGMEQQTYSKLGKEYAKSVYCHCACLTYMQSMYWEMLDFMKYNLESRLPGEISITSDRQMTPLL